MSVGHGELVRDLARALKTLDPEQGRVARANARRRVWKALASIRVEVTRDFPPIPKVMPKPTSYVSAAHRMVRARRKLRLAGWVEVSEMDVATVALAGIRPRVTGAGRHERDYWLPQWAVELSHLPPSKLRELRRKPQLRKALMAQKIIAEQRP